MKELKVLLCCGAGFSSGFLAQKTRKAAQKRKIGISIEAKSESVVSEYVNKIDVLLIGPHYESAFMNLKEICDKNGVIASMIPSDIYANLDGDSLLDFIIDLTNKEV